MDAPSLIGRTLNDQYLIVGLLGAGGMGAVYRARQLSVDREVAVKIVRPEYASDEKLLKRFETESNVISRLRHPNTLRLYDCQRTEDGLLFLVTELLHGDPLSGVAKVPLEVGRATRIVDQVCAALSEAHAAGVVHRDIKPDNVFLEQVGTEEVVKVLDFGIAKLAGSEGVTGTNVVGTAHYMSPEQATGHPVDARSDVYSVGVMFYRLLSGRLPFTGTNPVAVLYQHVKNEPPPLGVSVPEPIERLIFSMLQKSPELRPQSAEAVRAWIRDPPAAPTIEMPPRASPLPTPAPRRTGIWAAVVVGVMATLGLFAWQGWSSEEVEVEARPVLEAPAPAVTSKAQPRTVVIDSEPEGAVVVGPGGTQLGRTPAELALVPGQYRLELVGFAHATVTLTDEDAGSTVRVPLAKRTKRRRRRPNRTGAQKPPPTTADDPLKEIDW